MSSEKVGNGLIAVAVLTASFLCGMAFESSMSVNREIAQISVQEQPRVASIFCSDAGCTYKMEESSTEVEIETYVHDVCFENTRGVYRCFPKLPFGQAYCETDAECEELGERVDTSTVGAYILSTDVIDWEGDSGVGEVTDAKMIRQERKDRSGR